MIILLGKSLERSVRGVVFDYKTRFQLLSVIQREETVSRVDAVLHGGKKRHNGLSGFFFVLGINDQEGVDAELTFALSLDILNNFIPFRLVDAVQFVEDKRVRDPVGKTSGDCGDVLLRKGRRRREEVDRVGGGERLVAVDRFE